MEFALFHLKDIKSSTYMAILALGYKKWSFLFGAKRIVFILFRDFSNLIRNAMPFRLI